MEFTMENLTIQSIKKIRSVTRHPMKSTIRMWNDWTEDWTEEYWNLDPDRYFTSYYYNSYRSGGQKMNKIKNFIERNDFWIKMSELPNEEAVKLKHRAYLDKKRMHSKLKELDIKIYEVSITTHVRETNTPINFSKVMYKGKEIIY